MQPDPKPSNEGKVSADEFDKNSPLVTSKNKKDNKPNVGMNLRKGPTKSELFKILFKPDIDEIILFIISIFITIGIASSFSVPYIVEITNFQLLFFTISRIKFLNPAILFFLGFIGFLLFAYRWGYSSVQQAAERRKKIQKRHEQGEEYIADIKFIGFTVSLFLCGMAYLLRDYIIWFLD